MEEKNVSEKQKEFAKQIASVLEIDLPEKETKQEYWKFINNYIDVYKVVYYTQLLNKEEIKYSDIYKKTTHLVNKTGVYFLWHEEKLLYIGKSINLSERIVTSLRERNKQIKVTHFSYFETPTQADAHILEPYLIIKHKPILNSEFLTIDYSKMFNIVFDINSLEKYEVIE